MNKIAKLLLCLSRPPYARALIGYGVAAGVEHEGALRHLDCRTVIDIGANRGQFALAARRCFPYGKITSFEPLTRPYATYKRIFAVDANTVLYNFAIAPLAGNAIIHISKRDDSSSLLPITSAQTSQFPGTAEAGTAPIHAAPLDEFITAADIRSPAILKLDVQGYELEALKGCSTLLHCFAHVYVECSFVELYAGQALADQVMRWLCDRGFSLSGVYNMRHDRTGRAIQGDFLFARTE